MSFVFSNIFLTDCKVLMPLMMISLHRQVPQQKDEYDCGLFVLFFMQRFIEEAPQRLKKNDLAMVNNLFSY